MIARRMIAVGLLFALVFSAAGTVFGGGLSPDDLYSKAGKLFNEKQWDKAKDIYKALLSKHADSNIVGVHRVAITDRIMKCDFYKDEYEFEKVLKDHIGVKQFKLVEGRKPYMEMKFFFDDEKEAKLFMGAEVSGGGLVQKSLWFAPRIKFTDPFMMTMQTDALPPGGMYIVLCADENFKGEMKYYTIMLFRSRMSGFIIRKGQKELKRKVSYSIKIPDRTKVILSKVQGKIVLKAGKITVDAYDTTYKSGMMYMGGVRSGGLKIDELEIKSYVDNNWLQSLKGDLENTRWIKFKREYEKKYGKIEGGENVDTAGTDDDDDDDDKDKKKDERKSPLNPIFILVESLRKEVDKFPKKDKDEYNKCLDLLRERKYNEAEKKLDELIKKHPDSFAGYYFRAMVKMYNTDSDGALKDLEIAEQKAGELAYIPFAKGLVYIRKNEFKKAADEFEKSFKIDEHYMPAYIYRCLALYRGDDIQGAEEAMRSYVAKFPDDPIMKAGNKMFYLLKNGPAWTRKFTSEGDHYIVCSEISQKNADLTKNHAEAVFREYNKFFPYTKKSKDKYSIFIFASFGSFADYAIDSGEMPPHHGIGGLYNSNLDHLLLRGDRSQAKLLGTLYHEGLHQYLEYHIKDAPIWFNEGLATMFEVSYFDKYGRFRTGVVNRQRLSFLDAALRGRIRGASLQSIEDIMCSDHSAFMKGMGYQVLLNYAQSWSLIYLMITEKALMDRFLRPYFELLCEGTTKEEAYEKIFKPHARQIEKIWKSYYLDRKYKKHL